MRRHQAVTHIHHLHQVRPAIGVGVAEGGHGRRVREGALAIGILHLRAAEFILRLNVERHIPRCATRHELQQTAVGLVAGDTEIHQQPLALHIHADLGFRRIILIGHLRQIGRIKLRAVGDPVASERDRHGLEIRERGGPDLGVFAQILRPLDRQVRRGGQIDLRVLGLQPVNLDLVRVVVLPLGMVNKLSIGQRRGSVERLAAGLRGVGGQRGNQVRLFWRIPRRELLAEGHLDIDRFGIALGGDHVGTEELAFARAGNLRPKVFDKHTALEIVGMQGASARHVVIPQRPAFRGRGVARIVARVVAHRHELIHHVAGHETVVNHIGRHDPSRRNVHQRAIE